MIDNKESVSHCIDNICQLGCDGVRNVISAIEKGESPDPVDSLSGDDRGFVLTELKEIMAVYDAEEEQK